MISIKNILYTLDDIVFNGIDVVKERKITPRIKKEGISFKTCSFIMLFKQYSKLILIMHTQ